MRKIGVSLVCSKNVRCVIHLFSITVVLQYYKRVFSTKGSHLKELPHLLEDRRLTTCGYTEGFLGDSDTAM